MNYYIFRESCGHEYYRDNNGEMHSFKNPYTHYALGRKPGEFFGRGNFCGYYSVSGYENADIFAEAVSTVDINEDEDAVTATYTYTVRHCANRNVEDSYKEPEEFDADDDEKAYEFFEDYCDKYREVWYK